MQTPFFNFKSYINGKFIDQKDHITINSPLSLKACGKVPALTKLEIDDAFQGAQKAFANWKDLPSKTRMGYIARFAKLLHQKSDELAKLINLECGKTFQAATNEIARTISYIEMTMQAWPKIKQKTDTFQTKKSIQHRVPLGVVLAISAFNYPVNLAMNKIIPALLVGNTIVYKAATNGSLVGGFIAKLWHEVKLPPGVFNFATGLGHDIGDMLTTHKEIKMINFTGSVKTGLRIAKLNPLVPKVLELGGNDCAYVRSDANLDLAVQEIAEGAFSFSGQRCTAIKRLIIAKDVEKAFIEKLMVKVMPLKMDPIITQKAAHYLKELYEAALQDKKAKAIIKPTFSKNYVSIGLVHSTSNSRLWNEEQFGPVLPYVVANNDKEAIQLINQTDFGLQNSLFTTDIKWATNIAQKIESGTVNINGKSSRSPDYFPFLGIKNSGVGVQGIVDSLLAMTRVLSVVTSE